MKKIFFDINTRDKNFTKPKNKLKKTKFCIK